MRIKLTDDDVQKAVITLAEVFSDYPLFDYIYKSDRKKILRQLRFILLCCRNDYIFSLFDCKGILVMQEPGSNSYNLRNMLFSGLLKNVFLNGFPAMLRLLDMYRFKLQLRKELNIHDCFIGEILGVSQELQNKGVSTALHKEALEIVDKEGKSFYIETSVIKNVHYYKRFGFDLIKTTQYHKVPIYCMIRAAQK